MASNFNGTPGLVIDNAYASTWVDRTGNTAVNTLERSMAKSVVITKVSADAYIGISGVFATTMADGSTDVIRVKNWVEFPKAELAAAVQRAIAAGEIWEASLPIGQNQIADCRIIKLEDAQAVAWGVDLTEAIITKADGSSETVPGFIALTTSAYLSLLESSVRSLKPVAKANQASVNRAFDRTEIASLLPELKARRHVAMYLNTKTGEFVNLLATPRGTQRVEASQQARDERVAGTVYAAMSEMPVQPAATTDRQPLTQRVRNGFGRF
jgi:hypothetical protein